MVLRCAASRKAGAAVISAELYAQAQAIAVCDRAAPVVSYAVPVVTKSKLNERHGHWAQRSASAKGQRAGAYQLFPKGQPGALAGRLVVRLVRRAPRRLDGDNLAGALKSVRDGVADALGVDDRNPRVRWVVDQETARAADVLVEVYVAEVWP